MERSSQRLAASTKDPKANMFRGILVFASSTFSIAFLLNSGTLRTRFPILLWCVAETQKGDIVIGEGGSGGERRVNVNEGEEGVNRGSGRTSSPEQEIISENWKMQN